MRVMERHHALKLVAAAAAVSRRAGAHPRGTASLWRLGVAAGGEAERARACDDELQPYMKDGTIGSRTPASTSIDVERDP